MKKTALLLLLLASTIFAQGFEDEVQPVKVGTYESLYSLKLTASENGKSAVLLVMAAPSAETYYNGLYGHPVRPLRNNIIVQNGRKLNTSADRVQQVDMAFDTRTQTFLAVWSEYVVINGQEASSIFAQRFAANGTSVGGRKILYTADVVHHFSPAIVSEATPDKNATFRLYFTKRDNLNPANSGVYLANLDEKGNKHGSPLFLIPDRMGFSGTVGYYALDMFMRPNGQVVLGIKKSYYNGQGTRYDDIYSISVNKNGSMKQGKPFFHVRNDASYSDQYVFGQASVSNFTAATLDFAEGTGGYFWRFRANQTRIKGQYRISSDDNGDTIAMVSDKNFNLYCLIQKDTGILVVPFDRNGKAVMQKQIYYTFTGAKANGFSLTAAYNEKYDSIMVGFQDYSLSGSSLYIAYLPLEVR